MVVRVARAVAVDLVLRGDGPAAGTASDETSERKRVSAWMHGGRTPDRLLDQLELGRRQHGFMPTDVAAASQSVTLRTPGAPSQDPPRTFGQVAGASTALSTTVRTTTPAIALPAKGGTPTPSGRTAQIALVQAAVSAPASTGNVVYQAVDEAGRVIYVGITNNLTTRAAQQLATKGIRISQIRGLTDLTRSDARAVEQVLIETYGRSAGGGSLMNKINSISKNNPIYEQSIARGKVLLQESGLDAEALAQEYGPALSADIQTVESVLQ